MIEIYDSANDYIASVDSYVQASRLTGEQASTVRNRLNNPIEGRYNYYTKDNRGYLLRLSFTLYTLARQTEYPTPQQIEIIGKAVRELLK